MRTKNIKLSYSKIGSGQWEVTVFDLVTLKTKGTFETHDSTMIEAISSYNLWDDIGSWYDSYDHLVMDCLRNI